MRHLKWLLPLSLLFALGPGCGGKPPRSFHDTERGFSYTPPAGWTVTLSRPSRYRCHVGPAQGGVTPSIVVFKSEHPGTVQAYADYAEAEFKRSGAFLTSPGKDPFKTEDGEAGVRWHYTADLLTTNPPRRVRISDYLLGTGDYKYSLHCTAPAEGGEAYDAIFDSVAKSFRID